MHQQVNAIDFGDSTIMLQDHNASAESPTSGIIAGGGEPPAETDAIEFITISTLGNAADFGDLTDSGDTMESGCSNAIRGFAGGGWKCSIITLTY